MLGKTSRNSVNQSSEPSCGEELCLSTDAFCYMCFFKPPRVQKEEEEKKINVIVVDYNAWEYSGCDYLWAGIVTRLGESIEARFGKWKVRICRLMIKLANQNTDHVASLKLKCGYLRCKLFVLLMAIFSFLILTIVFLILIAQSGNDLYDQIKIYPFVILMTTLVGLIGTILSGKYMNMYACIVLPVA